MNENRKKLILQIKNLNYEYNNEQAVLSNINIDIYEGEKVAILGSNGAGKSTFFLNINGVLKPKSGEIIYKGKKIGKKELNKLRKNIGIVFQDADNQIIASTVLGEVSFGPMNLKLPKEEVKQRVNEALSYMNLMDFKNRPPHYLSGGEKKRVSIADIIAMKSEIIIFDEPTASLDPLNINKFENVLEKLSNDKKTLLISTHDVDFAYKWAERIIVFCDGKVIADKKPIDIFKDDNIIKNANLKRPTMFEVYEILLSKGVIKNDNIYPKDINEFRKKFI